MKITNNISNVTAKGRVRNLYVLSYITKFPPTDLDSGMGAKKGNAAHQCNVSKMHMQFLNSQEIAVSITAISLGGKVFAYFITKAQVKGVTKETR